MIRELLGGQNIPTKLLFCTLLVHWHFLAAVRLQGWCSMAEPLIFLFKFGTEICEAAHPGIASLQAHSMSIVYISPVCQPHRTQLGLGFLKCVWVRMCSYVHMHYQLKKNQQNRTKVHTSKPVFTRTRGIQTSRNAGMKHASFINTRLYLGVICSIFESP